MFSCDFFFGSFAQGPTISPVYCKRDRKVVVDYYAIVICVPQKTLYKSVQQLRSVRHLLLSINLIDFLCGSFDKQILRAKSSSIESLYEMISAPI